MSFTYQQWKKRESEQRIINALSEGDLSFGELLESTELSKPVLSERLKGLDGKGKIEIVPDTKTKRFLYHLISESLDSVEEALFLLHALSMYVVKSLAKFAKDSSMSNEEFKTKLVEGIRILFTFKMYSYRLAPKAAQTEWLRNTLGLEFVKMMPQILHEERDILSYAIMGLSSEEVAIFESEDVEEAANRLIGYLKKAIKRISKK